MKRFDSALQQALLAAVETGDFAGARRAVDAGSQVSLPAVDGGVPPLVAAVRRRHASMVNWLLEQGAFAGASAGLAEPESAFAIAFRLGDRQVAQQILARLSYFGPEHFAEAALALARGPADDAESLRELAARCPARPLLSEYDTDRVLESAAGHGHAAILRFFLDQGARVRTLVPAARGGHTALVHYLAAHGASINAPERDTVETPLHAAVQAPRNAEATVEALLRLGCRTNGRDREGKTPIGRAVAIGRPELAKLISMLAPQCGPRWMREARSRRVAICRVFQSRGFGLGFDLQDRECPILWGGDDEGDSPVSAAEGLTNWRRGESTASSAHQGTRWFVPFMERLVTGQEFGLAELEAANPSLRLELELPDNGQSS